MVVKRVVPSPTPDRDIKKELQFLYWRRSAVDSLIRSLEQYNLSRPKAVEIRKRRIA
jgi:hypothetical protein